MFADSPKLKWKKVAFKKANATYDLRTVTRGAVDPVDQDLGWPDEEPAYRVYEGDVTVKGPALFGADDENDCTTWVIKGNLHVNGPLVVFQGDVTGVLFVTGNVTCTDCVVAEDGMVVVGGTLTATNTLATRLTQMGILAVAGQLTASTWLESGNEGMVWLGEPPPKARLVYSYTGLSGWPFEHRTEGSTTFDASAATRAEAVGDDAFALKKAALAGLPLFR